MSCFTFLFLIRSKYIAVPYFEQRLNEETTSDVPRLYRVYRKKKKKKNYDVNLSQSQFSYMPLEDLPEHTYPWIIILLFNVITFCEHKLC